MLKPKPKSKPTKVKEGYKGKRIRPNVPPMKKKKR